MILEDCYNKPFFSLIIPCHNPNKTIGRLFFSLKKQGIPNEDLEIIVVDDNSDSLDYWNTIKTFGLNVIFTATDVDVHCPGNTRREGMSRVTGKWLCFCDQDDFFEDNAFKSVRDYINSTTDHTIYVVSTIMRACKDNTYECHTEFVHKEAWLHGKWYSMENLIIPYSINFKKDLKTHEDIYFNSVVLSHLYDKAASWDELNVYTYRWVDNKDSLTRRVTEDRGYLFENFNDYITCASEPYWQGAKEKKYIFANQVIMTLLHAYFYYEFASYYYGAQSYLDVLMDIQAFLYRMVDELGMSLEFIVDFVYADPFKYEGVEKDCKNYCQTFIPKTSFRDFVFRLGQHKTGKENE